MVEYRMLSVFSNILVMSLFHEVIFTNTKTLVVFAIHNMTFDVTNIPVDHSVLKSNTSLWIHEFFFLRE